MKNWEEDDTDEYCSAAADLADAEQVCKKLDIPLHKVNFAAEYWDRVFSYFLEEYRAGRTPNPDILCNKEIKFKAFLDYAKQLGADYIATGHYARRRDINGLNGEVQLLKGSDPNKDQSYFLYTLGQNQLRHSLFPVGDLLKPHVRELAAQAGLITHSKKDSTGICFIGERRFKDFLAQYLPAQPGPMQTPEGKHMGQHDGLMYYTIGQRQGLGIGGQKDSDEQPWFVLGKDVARNILIVGQGHDHPMLYGDKLECMDLHWVQGQAPHLPLQCSAQIRYRMPDSPCTIEALHADRITVKFDAPQWAITPGQSIVFYDGEICLGGGVIA
jgi:tRNA-specific 2-thiouridylase